MVSTSIYRLTYEGLVRLVVRVHSSNAAIVLGHHHGFVGVASIIRKTYLLGSMRMSYFINQ